MHLTQIICDLWLFMLIFVIILFLCMFQLVTILDISIFFLKKFFLDYMLWNSFNNY